MEHILLNEVYMEKENKQANRILVTFTELSLTGVESNLIKAVKTLNLPNFLKEFKDKENTFLNFIIKNSLPVFETGLQVSKYTNELLEKRYQYYQSMNATLGAKQLSVLTLLNELSKTRTKLEFEEKYYHELSGGYTFTNFIPNFETARIDMSNLILSNSKFNVVLAASIDGTSKASFEDGENEYEIGQVFTRYVPFKLIKGGKLKHESIRVLVTDKNLQPLQDHYPNQHFTVGQIETISLTELPIFTIEPHRDLNTYYRLLMHLNMLKTSEKGVRYYLDSLKREASIEEFDSNEWYRGEPVDDEYISDVGDFSFEIWINRSKVLPSTNKTIKKLEGFGENLVKAVELLSQIKDINTDDYSSMFEDIRTNLDMYFKQHKTINFYEYSIILNFIRAMESSKGSREDRIKKLIADIKSISIYQSSVELKLLNLRKLLFDSITETNIAMNQELTSLGEFLDTVGDSVTLGTPRNVEIVFKRQEIKAKESSFDVTPKISTEADLNDF